MQERLGKHSFDVVVMNGLMPGGLSAQEIHQWIAKNCAGLEKRLLLTFSTETDAQTREFLQEHRVPWLAKPFEVADLISRVRELRRGELKLAETPADIPAETDKDKKENVEEKVTVAGAGA
jgi:DNA-binding response OmpR family regulator